MSSIELQSVRKSFGDLEVIKGIDIQIESGEFAVFVGPSGCGKSTLLRMIAGLESITKGKFLLDGKPMNDVAPDKRGIAMVFQSYALYPHMTVAENMGFSLDLKGMDKGLIRREVGEVADKLQLTDLLSRKPDTLSGGQRQRVAIGRAIIKKPSVILFDEPLSNLDASLRVQMRAELQQLHHTTQSTIIYVTHDQVEAMTLADKIVVLKEGEVYQSDQPIELYKHPANTFVAQFIGSPQMNLVPAKVVGGDGNSVKLQTRTGWSVVLPVGGKLSSGDQVTLGVRPEGLSLANSKSASDFSANVVVAERLGMETYITLNMGADIDDVVARVAGDHAFTSGQEVHFNLDPAACHLFDDHGNVVR